MATLGQKLAAARTKKNLTLSRAAALTRIKVQHLENMEQDDFSGMPAPTYAKGFIRIYAELLELDSEPLVTEYIEKHLERKTGGATPQRPAKKSPARPAREKHTTRGRDEKSPVIAVVEDWIAQLRGLLERAVKAARSSGPRFPQAIAAVVAVIMLVGIVRCTARLGSEDRDQPQPSLMDERAMMKEPSPRYLQLPTTEEPTP